MPCSNRMSFDLSKGPDAEVMASLRSSLRSCDPGLRFGRLSPIDLSSRGLGTRSTGATAQGVEDCCRAMIAQAAEAIILTDSAGTFESGTTALSASSATLQPKPSAPCLRWSSLRGSAAPSGPASGNRSKAGTSQTATMYSECTQPEKVAKALCRLELRPRSRWG